VGLAVMHACVCAAMATVLVDTVHRQPEYVHACIHTYIHTCSSKSARYALYLGSYVRTQCTYTSVVCMQDDVRARITTGTCPSTDMCSMYVCSRYVCT